MTKISDGGPAFPRAAFDNENFYDTGDTGMSLRDWFAGQALVGWMASLGSDATVRPARIASLVYELADAMVAEREDRG